MKKLIFIAAVSFAAACGGGQKSGLKSGGDVPPPPPTPQANNPNTKPGQEEKRVVSKEAKSDFQSAQAFFDQTDKANGWNESACRQAAEKFQSVAKGHADLVEAQYMIGLSYHRCNLMADAERAYQTASHMNGPY